MVVVDQTQAIVRDAKVLVTNTATGAQHDGVSGAEGTLNVGALPLTGTYTVHVEKTGFTAEDVKDLTLRSGETAVVKIKLMAAGAKSDVTVYGTTDGVRADAQISRRLDSQTIDELPILGRKVTSLPLYNSAFRQGKGTGDLFVNATYFITASGSRRTTTYMLDGASNDEGWGRQTMLTAVPLGAVQEATILSNAFSAEFGWTAGPAVNIVTKSGTNAFRGELLYMFRPGSIQATSFSTKNFCPPSLASCVTPTTLTGINPPDLPDELNQGSGSFGGPIKKDKTFFFVTMDYTAQDRTSVLSSTLPAFVLPPDGSLEYVGNYRQKLFDARVDHKITPTQTLMVGFNDDHFFDTNPNDAVAGTNAPTVARRYTRGGWRGQVNHTMSFGNNMLNEARLAFQDGSPVTLWEAQEFSTTYTRAGTVPFTIGQSRVSDLDSSQQQIADTISWTRGKHYFRFGGSATHHTSGGTGNEPGFAMLGTFTFKSATTAPFEELTLNDVQQYTEPINYGVSSYELSQWMYVAFIQDSWRVRDDLTLDLGLRYDRQTLTDANKNFAPRIGFGWHPGGDERLAIRGGYSMYYTQIRTNQVAGALLSGLDGFTSYTATPGQTGFPTCLTCVPLALDPRTVPASQLPARDITIRAGQADFYRTQFAQYGLNFDLLTNYPDALVNPRSQVYTIGAEREIIHNLFVGADYVHQTWDNLDRSVDLNAPTVFTRTAPGQTRSATAANATRPIAPVNGGVRNINVLMNLGEADYDGLQMQARYNWKAKLFTSLSYTLSKSTNTTEPDGNGVGPNEANITTLGETERGPSVVDQRHRAVITAMYLFPHNISAGTVMQLASGRPFTATTGVDNNGDGANNDRPVINGSVITKSAFIGTGTQDIALFGEVKLNIGHGHAIQIRGEVFNLFNHGNYLGRAQTIYGDTDTANASFGQLVSAGTATNALPSLANTDPPRMFQFVMRFMF